jgi:hypothetical protein
VLSIAIIMVFRCPKMAPSIIKKKRTFLIRDKCPKNEKYQVRKYYYY